MSVLPDAPKRPWGTQEKPKQRLFFHPLGDYVDGDGKNDGSVFLDADLSQSLQVTELNRGGLGFQHLSRFGELGRSFKFAGSVNHFGAAFAFGFRLFGDGALHGLRNIDLLDLNFGYLDTPRLRILVKNDLQFGVYLFALG